MSISLVGGQSPSLIQILKDKRTAMRAMMSAVEAGDMTSAQSNAAAVQKDQSQLDAILGDGSSASAPNAGSDPRSKMRADLSSLLSAVQGGDQGQASAALAQLKADRPMEPAAGRDADGDDRVRSTTSSRKSLVTDLKSMLSAIVSGDATGASSYASSLKSDLDSVLGASSGSPAAASASPAAAPSGGSTASFLDDLKSLISAVQSGDAASTQAAAATLTGDATAFAASLGHRHHGHRAGGAEPQGGNSPQSILGLLNSAAAPSTAASAASTPSAAAA